VDDETILAAGLFQNCHKQVASPGRTQFWLATVATAGDEVQIMPAIIAMERLVTRSK
jgi:hypothetical protein